VVRNFFPRRNSVSGPSHYRGFTITLIQKHHTRYGFSGRSISPTYRLLPDNIQH